MRYLSAIAIAAFVAGAVLAVNSVGSLPLEKQSTPMATQVAARLAQSVDPFLLQSGGQRPTQLKTHWRRLLGSAASGALSGPVR